MKPSFITGLIALFKVVEAVPARVPSVSSSGSSSEPSSTSESKSSVRKLVVTKVPQKVYATTVPTSTSSSSISNPVGFSGASGSWLDVPCSASGMTDASVPAPTRWAAADVPEAWSQVMSSWNESEAHPVAGALQLGFSQFVYNGFHYQEGANCGDFEDGVCESTVMCQGPPAGFLIINSIVSIHNSIKESTDALTIAANNIKSSAADFANTFAGYPDTSKNQMIVKIILDALTFGLAFTGAIMFNIVLKSAIRAGTVALMDGTESALNSVTNAAIAIAFVTAKDTMKAPANPFEEASSMTELLQIYYNQFMSINSNFLESILGAENSTSQSHLTDLIAGGAMLQSLELEKGNRFTELTAASQQVLYGKLIPAAWSIAPTKPNPVILRVDKREYTCGAPVSTALKGQLGKYMNDDCANKTSWCDAAGNSWFLVNAKYGSKDSTDKSFQPLDGGDKYTLNALNVTIEDIVTSTYGGFKLNGNKNGYEIPMNSSYVVDQAFDVTKGALPAAGGIRTPGFFNFTLCPNMQEAAERVKNGVHPPCPDVPDMTEIPTEDGYRPGWCGVHVTQWKKNQENDNPLDYYQLAITVRDQGDLPIGYVSKQVVEKAIAVKSKLQYDVIVQAGQEDDDPVCFWYAGQTWCGSDTSQQCTWGSYDGAKREGDCGFTCDAASNATQASAYSVSTASTTGSIASFPTPALTKSNSTLSRNSTAGTVTTTSASSSAKASFVPGQCGVHVRQIQKNEQDLNPTSNFVFELTLYDANQTLIAYSNDQGAATNATVSLQGPLPGPVSIVCGAEDEDDIPFSYEGAKWNSSEETCKFGGYDSGHRDGDCSFKC